ncbi:MAG: aminopeptidase P N-terminal domain-containing protein [Acidobacteriota bacterium]|nr:aminopeptidase P N-terminal domain-containing protein [Acidobacteriota bacterium]
MRRFSSRLSRSCAPRMSPIAFGVLAAALSSLSLARAAAALDLPPVNAPREMFRAHREKFLAKLPPGSLAILHAAPQRMMSNDTEYLYRQDSDFYYLTGLEDPDAIAVFRPGASDNKRYVLFVRARDPRAETYQGPRPGPEGAVSTFGADAAFPITDFQDSVAKSEGRGSLGGYLAGVDTVYLWDGGDETWADRFRGTLAKLRARDAGPAAVVDAREILHELRLIKDADELALLRRASEISARAHAAAMAAAAPGKYEFEVQQALDSYCGANGARRMAYPSIAASGPNSVFLHWDRNDRELSDGDVLLNDSGAEYRYYAADVTRTYPVNGRFTAEQRAVYEAVLAAQKIAIARVRPGATHDEIEQASARSQTEGLVRLGLLSGDVDKLVSERAYFKFTRHGISHWVGMDVHDPARYRVGSASRVLAPGMVLTIEPGIYIPANMAGVDRKWWNIGVRIEDTLAVTATGSECLSCGAPREIADVEKAVRKK